MTSCSQVLTSHRVALMGGREMCETRPGDGKRPPCLGKNDGACGQ